MRHSRCFAFSKRSKTTAARVESPGNHPTHLETLTARLLDGVRAFGGMNTTPSLDHMSSVLVNDSSLLQQFSGDFYTLDVNAIENLPRTTPFVWAVWSSGTHLQTLPVRRLVKPASSTTVLSMASRVRLFHWDGNAFAEIDGATWDALVK